MGVRLEEELVNTLALGPGALCSWAAGGGGTCPTFPLRSGQVLSCSSAGQCGPGQPDVVPEGRGLCEACPRAQSAVPCAWAESWEP